MSFVICIGKFAWPKIEFNSRMLRIVIGPVSGWILFYDFERVLAKVQTIIDKEK